jgi:predicted HicB family RNase H-like nuclease
MEKKTGRPKTGSKPNTSVRVDLEVLHEARIAAVIQRKTLGSWIEEAIHEKIERDEGKIATKKTP